MAIWQFKLELLPEEAIRRQYGHLPVTVPEDLAESFPWWSDWQPPGDFEARIGAFLPRAKSWSENLLIWGDERSDAALVSFDTKRRVDSIEFRVDVHSLSQALVKEICLTAKQFGCVLMTRAYHIMAPDEATVLAAINNSTAKRFVEDPVSTLVALKHQGGEVIPFPQTP